MRDAGMTSGRTKQPENDYLIRPQCICHDEMYCSSRGKKLRTEWLPVRKRFEMTAWIDAASIESVCKSGEKGRDSSSDCRDLIDVNVRSVM